MKTASNALTKVTVESYFGELPEPVRLTLEKVRMAIKSAAPNAEETVSYGIPTYKYNGSLVGLGAAQNHCALYVMSPQVMQEFISDLKAYDTSKGTIRFPQDKPLPANLVRKIVKARLKENQSILAQRKLKANRRG